MASRTDAAGDGLLETAPVFAVSDVEASADYYRDRLGFAFSRFWGEPPAFCIPYRDGIRLVLDAAEDPDDVTPNGADGHGWDAYVWIADAAALFAEFEESGARLRSEPVHKEEYGLLEFVVEDPDGYALAFGEDVA